MSRNGPKSPALEKGSLALAAVPQRAIWSTGITRRRPLLAGSCLILLLTFVCVRYYRLSPHLLAQIAIYRLARGCSPLDVAVLDSTRSRLHKAVLRPSIAYELHNLEASGVFADWYGNPAEAGPSPFDYKLLPEWQTLLPGRRLWSVVTGNSCSSGEDNELCDLASVLASSKHRTIHEPRHYAPRAGVDVLLSPPHARIPKAGLSRPVKLNIDILDECAGHNCTAQLDVAHGGITLVRHAFELIDFFEYAKLKAIYGTFKMQLFGHLAFAADPSRYYPYNDWELKTVDVLDVDGVFGDSIRGRSPSPEEYRMAKVCLFSSTPKKGLTRQWIKAMLSGCVIVSDMPTESEEALSKAIISYDASDNIDNIRSIVRDALQGDLILKKKALRGFVHARRWHTPAYQAGYILQLSELHRAGERGCDVGSFQRY